MGAEVLVSSERLGWRELANVDIESLPTDVSDVGSVVQEGGRAGAAASGS